MSFTSLNALQNVQIGVEHLIFLSSIFLSRKSVERKMEERNMTIPMS